MKIETADGMYEEGLSLKGEINTTYWTLVDTFGEPTESGEPMLDTTVGLVIISVATARTGSARNAAEPIHHDSVIV